MQRLQFLSERTWCYRCAVSFGCCDVCDAVQARVFVAAPSYSAIAGLAGTVAMFSNVPWASASPAVPPAPVPAPDGRRRHDGSRSPSRNAGGLRVASGAMNNGAASAYPVTGVALTERWYNDHVTEPQILLDFMEVPQWRRKNVILKCIEKPPENPHSWIFAVIRNHRNSELERRLTTEANVHMGRSIGYAPPLNSLPCGGLSPQSQRQDPARHTPMPVQPVLPFGASDSSGSASHEPPLWAAEMIALWPSHKSRLVAHFLSVLTPTNQAAVVALVPQTQACVALAVALSAHEHTSADALTTECVRRLLVSGSGPSSSPRTGTLSATPVASAVSLQLVFVSHESSVSLVLAKSFIVAMDKMSPGAFTYLPLIVISLHEGPSMMAEAERLKLPMNTSTTSLASLETFIESSKVNFKTYHIKTLFVSMIHAVNGVGARVPSQRNVAVLHGDSFRFMWTVARCSQALRTTTGDDAVCELLFAPSKLSDEVKVELAKVIGPLNSTGNVSYNAIAPVPTVFGTPGGCGIVKVCRSDYETQTMDGWCATGNPQVSEELPGGLIAFIAKTAELAVFQERPWTPLEQRTVEHFTMTHQDTGERRLCSRDWWLRWYGYARTPLQAMLISQHPCYPVIFAVTGSPAPADAVGAEACGKQRFCVACEKVFGVLDGTYCLPVMVDAAVALMVKARQLWSGGCDDAAWARTADVNRVHQCGPSCPLAV